MRRCLFILAILLCGAATAQEVLKGKASYYSDKLHGRRMSNGQPYNRDSMTCAHLRFPFGTMLKVRNPLNGKEVVVKVTDRGPHVKKFIIDLSRAAAKELGILAKGFCQVEITPYHKNVPPYRPEDEEQDIPELDLDYSPAATYPDPAWKADSVKANAPAGLQPSDTLRTKDSAGSGRRPAARRPAATKPAPQGSRSEA